MKAKMFFLLTAFTMVSMFFAACGNEANDADDKSTETTETAAPPAPVAEIKLTPFSSSPDFPNASLDFGYDKGMFTAKVANYELKQQTADAAQKMCANSKDGQHIHFIVDDQPYDAAYETPFKKEIPDGSHYLLGFLGRSYHESIKSKAAGKVLNVDVKAGSITKKQPVTDPMVFYSRPKGKYVGKAETEKVMLDFYLANTTLSADGNKVKVLINGEKEFILDKWEPVFLEGLPMVDNKIKLTLVDKDGNDVKAPLNPVERVFTLIEDQTEK